MNFIAKANKHMAQIRGPEGLGKNLIDVAPAEPNFRAYLLGSTINAAKRFMVDGGIPAQALVQALGKISFDMYGHTPGSNLTADQANRSREIVLLSTLDASKASGADQIEIINAQNLIAEDAGLQTLKMLSKIETMKIKQGLLNRAPSRTKVVHRGGPNFFGDQKGRR